jgi:hypothetical protein
MRAFVVGNGPSLKADQLEKLIPEVSFGVNRIHLIYDQTRWRPDLEFHSQQGYPCYVRSDIVAKFIERYVGEKVESGVGWDINAHLKNIEVVEQCSHIDAERHTTDKWHLDWTLCKQGGSVSCAIQLAVKLGYGPIYLIGCDGDLKGNANNHFIEGYVDRDAMTVQKARTANKTLEVAHSIAFKECKERKIQILNATVGGTAIGGIPECDFYELF